MEVVSKQSESNWAWLPKNLFASILDRFTQFSDYVNFCSVCKNWRLIVLEENNHKYLQMQRQCLFVLCQNQLPLLMIQNADNDKEKRSFYSVKAGATVVIQWPLSYNGRCFGSSYGWLLTVDKNMVVKLLNPFTDDIICLPQFNDPTNEYQHWIDNNYYDGFIRKGILSSDPNLNPQSYEVIVIYGWMRHLALYKIGGKAWIFLDISYGGFQDIQCYEGHFFAINNWGQVAYVDVVNGIKFIIKQKMRDFCGITYLLNSQEGNSIMVRRKILEIDEEIGNYRTTDFELFKMVLRSDNQFRWIRIETLGNEAFFLGDSYSLSVSTLEFSYCQPNSTYFTDHYSEFGPYISHGVDDDTGVFHLKDKSFGSHYVPDFNTKHLSPAIWVVPHLKENLALKK